MRTDVEMLIFYGCISSRLELFLAKTDANERKAPHPFLAQLMQIYHHQAKKATLEMRPILPISKMKSRQKSKRAKKPAPAL